MRPIINYPILKMYQHATWLRQPKMTFSVRRKQMHLVLKKMVFKSSIHLVFKNGIRCKDCIYLVGEKVTQEKKKSENYFFSCKIEKKKVLVLTRINFYNTCSLQTCYYITHTTTTTHCSKMGIIQKNQNLFGTVKTVQL